MRLPFQSAILSLAAIGMQAGLSGAFEPQSPYLRAELTARKSTPAAPVRLPPIEVLVIESAATSMPFVLTPIANLNLEEFQTAPEVKLGIGQPSGEKPSIGGWISFGGTSGGLIQ